MQFFLNFTKNIYIQGDIDKETFDFAEIIFKLYNNFNLF